MGDAHARSEGGERGGRGPYRRARHQGRELAVRVLFQLELQPGDWRAPLVYQLREAPQPPGARSFAEELLEGAVGHAGEIDTLIGRVSSHWSLDQMGAVERAVLRLGVEELRFRGREPAAVVIDEAVELAKQMAGPEAARFVNGVLGQMAREPEDEDAAAAGR